MLTIRQARIAMATGASAVVTATGDEVGVLAVHTNLHDGWSVETHHTTRGGTFRPDELEPTKELLTAAEDDDEFDSLGFRAGEQSPEQTKIYEQADDLLNLINEVVPSNVAHWVVEEARRALRDLTQQAGTISTYDRRPPVADEPEDPRGCQERMAGDGEPWMP